MPYAPKRPCSQSGCSALIDPGTGSKCEEHRKESAQGYQRYRGSSTKQGYDEDWNRVRLKALKRDEYLCRGECMEKGILTPAQHVDHVKPFKGKSDPLRLDLTNLKSLCKPCHSRKTAKYDGGFGRQIKRTE